LTGLMMPNGQNFKTEGLKGCSRKGNKLPLIKEEITCPGPCGINILWI
jgi:hypothetical protein